jgi:hypothetical protein
LNFQPFLKTFYLKIHSNEYDFSIMMNNDNRKKYPEKFDVRPFFPALSVCTSSLIYQIRKPLVHHFPLPQRLEGTCILTYPDNE